MRIFMTGANGFIGRAVVRELQGAGHTVIGLARSAETAKSLAAAGVEVHQGALTDIESLTAAASKADGVIHLAFIHGPGQLDWLQRLRVFGGGLPTGVVARFGAEITRVDSRAIDAMAGALKGSGRPFIAAFGTMGLAPGGMSEADLPDPRSPGAARAVAETAVHAWADRGVRAMIMRLPPSVHGDGDKGLVPQIIKAARKAGSADYVGNGRNRWCAVHRDDAAHLFRLALERGDGGACYHGVAEEGIAFADIAAVIARKLGIPSQSLSKRAAQKRFSWLAPFCSVDNPATSEMTRQALSWAPTKVGLLTDMEAGAYFTSARKT
ncbi:NAD-dependent epimerase/dehydratase [Gluconacetobacter diazotrophicus PA1 5]|uniref:SDR family oxidoreductase n=1 Tax=Gluconacetobacter diazotrophicus TaxID=33996 RepID=UPI000173BE21|nr:SDR family oxidoreductase [Gluconacetobacter diazotrophicus]ACI50775.1 NAD-dependent epimerase/dehydratase [Gluconacetobacter diazotrophicus PA1 5]